MEVATNAMTAPTLTILDQPKVRTTQLRLSSGDGPITRTVLDTPLRDASPSELPIIDASKMYSSSYSERLEVAKQLRDACTNTGFFYIKNHGVAPEVLQASHKACLEFFRQDPDVKQRAESVSSKSFNGYHPPKSQRINPFESIDVRESFSWKYDPVYDESVTDVSTIPPEVAKFLTSDDFIWEATANLPKFKGSVIAHWQACIRLARTMVRSFALSLDLAEDFFDAKFAYPDATFTVNYYPPIERTAPQPQETTQVSIGSHTDFQLFTILWQDTTGGLQVLNRDGQWINAKPVEGTFVVNIADYLQRITNGLYVSTVHRVQNWSGKERMSIPFFFGFSLNESCAVLDSCVKPGEVKKYEEISCANWLKRRVSEMHRTS